MVVDDDAPEPMEECEHCWVPRPESTLVWVQTAKRTHDSPAEYERWSTVCCAGEDRDEAYERGNQRYRERTGSEL